MRVKLAIGCVAMAVMAMAATMGCGSAGATSTGSGGSAGGDPCVDTFLEVTGDGLPQRFTAVSGREAAGTLVLGGHAEAPGDATLTLTSDKLGSTTLGHGKYDRGTQHFSGDHAAVTITKLGAVGEAIEGSYAATLMPVTVGITLSLSGKFKLCRGADGTM